MSIARGSYYDFGQWATWLTSQTPLGVTNVDVRLESAFDSHSTLLIVSLTTYAWVRLPEKAAYHFVGFIKSGNLLSNDQASADSTTRHSRQRKSTVLKRSAIRDLELISLSDFSDQHEDPRIELDHEHEHDSGYGGSRLSSNKSGRGESEPPRELDGGLKALLQKAYQWWR